MPTLRDKTTGQIWIDIDPGSQQHPRPLTQARADELVASGRFEAFDASAATAPGRVPAASLADGSGVHEELVLLPPGVLAANPTYSAPSAHWSRFEERRLYIELRAITNPSPGSSGVVVTVEEQAGGSWFELAATPGSPRIGAVGRYTLNLPESSADVLRLRVDQFGVSGVDIEVRAVRSRT